MAKIVEAVRPTPEQRLAAERGAISDVEQEIVGLREIRAAKLLDDDLAEALKIGEKIAAAERRLGVHRDRVEALKREVRRVEQERLDRERAALIAETERAIVKRDEKAAELETAIRDMGRLYFELIDQNQVIARQWSMSSTALRVGLLGEALVAREVSHALFAVGRPQGGICRLPAPDNVGLGIAGANAAGSFAERIAGASRDLLEMVRAIPQPEQDAA